MRYDTLTLEQGGALDSGAIEEAAERLDAGQLLIHPTVTLYGIGARATPELDREICEIKGRSPDTPLIRLAASRAHLEAAVPALAWPEAAERLAAAFWPGPLTLVLDDGSLRGMAVRVESHPATAAVLERAGVLMSSTSLNATGQRPAATAAEAAKTASTLPDSGRTAVLLSVARPLGGEPSTVVSVRGGTFEVLREGAIPAPEVRAALTPGPGDGSEERARVRAASVLFVCTGNTCRSPLAEVILRATAEQRGAAVEVRSAGTGAWDGQPAADHGIAVAAEHGLDLTSHASRTVDPELARRSSLVVVMGASHAAAVHHLAPGARVVRVTEFLPDGHPERGQDVPDPVGGSLEDYRRTYSVLEDAAPGILDALDAG